MEYIILGFVLFIVGVGATIIYDKQKENAFKVPKFIIDSLNKPRKQPKKKSLPQQPKVPSRKDADELVKKIRKQLNDSKKKPKPHIKRDMSPPFPIAKPLTSNMDEIMDTKYVDSLIEEIIEGFDD